MAKLIDLNAYQATNIELKKYIDNEIKKNTDEIVVQKETYLNFPTVGQVNAIYIDTTKKTIYRWNSIDLKYYVVVDSYENIDVINGCGK